jgi:hypothetical protein
MAKLKRFMEEASQFVPVITLASSFIVAGGVDLSRAGTLFVVSAASAVVITAVLIKRKVLLNPILVGTNLWLCLGALAFGIPIAAMADIMAEHQAVDLFACTFALGIVFTAVKTTGFIGMRHPDSRVIKKLSIVMLALTAAAVIWSVAFMDNIRLGGALPFIVLNVTRRVLMRRKRAA